MKIIVEEDYLQEAYVKNGSVYLSKVIPDKNEMLNNLTDEIVTEYYILYIYDDDE